jgi:hypothetical protein
MSDLSLVLLQGLRTLFILGASQLHAFVFHALNLHAHCHVGKWYFYHRPLLVQSLRQPRSQRFQPRQSETIPSRQIKFTVPQLRHR